MKNEWCKLTNIWLRLGMLSTALSVVPAYGSNPPTSKSTYHISADKVSALASQDENQANNAIKDIDWNKLGPSAGGLVLVRALSQTTIPPMKIRYLRLLSSYGPDADPAAARAVKALYADISQPESVRDQAALTVASFEPHSKETVSILMDALQHWSYDRSEPLAALVRTGPAATEAVPSLVSMLGVNKTFQYPIFDALGQIEASNQQSSVPASSDLISSDPTVASAAFVKFRTHLVNDPVITTVLAKIITTDPRVVYRLAAIDTFKRWGVGESPTAVQVLLASVANRRLATTANDVLATITANDTLDVPVLVEGLDAPDPRIVDASAKTLTVFGAKAAAAAPALLRLLNGVVANQRGDIDLGPISLLIIGIHTKDSAFGQAIVSLLPPNSPITGNRFDLNASSQLFAALAEVGPPRSALSPIQMALEQKLNYLYAPTARAAGALGPVAAPVVPDLINYLGPSVGDITTDMNFVAACGDGSVHPANSTSTKLETILALGKIGPAAIAAIPVLQRIANRTPTTSYDIKLSVAARQAIDSITKNGEVYKWDKSVPSFVSHSGALRWEKT